MSVLRIISIKADAGSDNGLSQLVMIARHARGKLISIDPRLTGCRAARGEQVSGEQLAELGSGSRAIIGCPREVPAIARAKITRF